jgi:hypothetical protein
MTLASSVTRATRRAHARGVVRRFIHSRYFFRAFSDNVETAALTRSTYGRVDTIG